MKTSSVFAALAAVCASFAWAGTSRDVAPEGVFKDGSVVLFIGDSITHGGRCGDMNHYLGHGYQAEVAARYLGYRPDKGLCFRNRAISGDTTENLLKRWENDVFNLKFGEKGWHSPFPERTGTLKPDVVSLLVGINDFYWLKSGSKRCPNTIGARAIRSPSSDSRSRSSRLRTTRVRCVVVCVI